jgi:hypothetical protein
MAHDGFRAEGRQKPLEESLLIFLKEEVGIIGFFPDPEVAFFFFKPGDLIPQVPVILIDVDPVVH